MEIKTLTYNNVQLLCDLDLSHTDATITYSTDREGDVLQRAEYYVTRAVWDTLEAVLGKAHDLTNLHFCGYWVVPSNQELLDRVIQGRKPCGSVIYSETEDSAERLTEIAWLNARATNPSIDNQIEVLRVPVREGYTKFLIGSTKPMEMFLNWHGFVELANIQQWPIKAEWGTLKPLELLRLQEAEFEFPTSDVNTWAVGLSLGYHPATTASFNDGSAEVEYSG